MRRRSFGFYDRMQQLELAQFGEQTGSQNPVVANAQARNPNQPQAQVPSGTAPNPFQPIGDPIQTIAQMLGLDLSAQTSPDQQAQQVVQAVEALINKLHEAYGQGDPNAPQQGDEYDQQNPDENDPSNDDQNPEPDQDEEQQPPQRQKLTASFGGMEQAQQVLDLAYGNRIAQIKQLISDGYLTPFGAQKMADRHCTGTALSLSLELGENSISSFDAEVEQLVANGRVIGIGEKSSHQSRLSTLSMDGSTLQLASEDLVTEKNPMVASAIALRSAAEKRRTYGK